MTTVPGGATASERALTDCWNIAPSKTLEVTSHDTKQHLGLADPQAQS
jgi:hypothetical protein